MYNPVATYRIQLHNGFNFTDLEEQMPYLQKLGVPTIYASPLLQAIQGSTHGYDGVDPHRINKEIGTEDQFRKLCQRLSHAGIGWLQDIVPNHMAFDKDNRWLMDVLKKGKSSEYGDFFDIQWEHPLFKDRVMVPFSGSELEEYLKKEGISDTYYRLSGWQETNTHINYRRFFIVNNLICLNIQNPRVFDAYHSYIKYLLDEGLIQGLRIDHIDGLLDPLEYLQRLRQLAGEESYIIVEKILERGEELPDHWPVQGTTGYDFMAMVNNLFTRRENQQAFTDFYELLIEDKRSVEEQTHEKKEYILSHYMQGELENLCNLFINSGLADEGVDPPVPCELIKEAIGEFLIQCPVYRYYGNSMPLDAKETIALREIFSRIAHQKPSLAPAVNCLERAILVTPHNNREEHNRNALYFYQRCMQFSGPLMAKGLEDTLMYTYNRFIGHNEVGDSPAGSGLSAGDFHREMTHRREHSPFSLNATSTHDTKRGEDARARLNVLTDMPDEWFQKVKEWYRINSHLQENGAPDINDEYFIYQSLLAAYHPGAEDNDDFNDRFAAYLTKALREAKRKSDWARPDEAYENTTKTFALHLLNKTGSFRQSFEQLLGIVEGPGIIYSLAQVILKFCCPGIPDIYQGCELWDHSFADPDNRRPVNYAKRRKLLDQISDTPENTLTLTKDLWHDRASGSIKLWLIKNLLNERKKQTVLFCTGDYIPLIVKGEYSGHVLAFARRYQHQWYVIIIPLYLPSICREQNRDVVSLDWKDTSVLLPPEAPVEWTNILLTGRFTGIKEFSLKELFVFLPFAVLKQITDL